MTTTATSPQRGTIVPVLALTVLTLIWGVSVPMMKLGLRDLTPLALVSWRYLCAAPFFAVLLVGRQPPGPRAFVTLAAIALFGLTAGQILQIIGIGLTSAAIATIITATIPIFTVLLAAFRLHQPVRPRHMLGLALALAGIALGTGGAAVGEAGSPLAAVIGDGVLLLASICIAGYYVFSAEAALRLGVVTVSAWSTILGALCLSPVAVWSVVTGQIHPTPVSIGVIAYLSLLVTLLGISIWLFALRTLPVAVAASSQYIQPLIGVAASAVMFGTVLHGRFFIGTALVIAGMALCAAPSGRNIDIKREAIRR